ncbi:hypothetical protein [Miltoncostaea oceani]|uniref:hypothetical protein n=1 Tax=Miltoncostaea oceani TaxID=2843216 RepID=UPI001C3E1F2E|nr:hypothetical protein [Miltoncostaea oceani]
MRLRRVIVALPVVLAMAAPPALAVAPGSGVRGTLTASWDGVAGAPITQWSGSARFTFDPSAAARRATLAAIADPALGEPTRRPFAPQVQAARATDLAYTRTETVICQTTTEDGEPSEYTASATSSAAGVADGRVAFEILPPRLDLITGRGTVGLAPYLAPDPNGWYIADRFALPGRHTTSGAYPCPGSGVPAERLARIIALNGQGAVPRPITDWLTENSRSLDWPVRRTRAGWRVMISLADRPTFSDSPFGPQDTQRMDVRIGSELYLAGSLPALDARCHVPEGLIARARSARAAVALARRAGLRATYAGVKRFATLDRSRYVVTGRIGMGYGTCGRGTYRVWRYTP